jgi:putative N6-adenine-specific DNA methylase
MSAPASESHRAFAVCPLGLEAVAADEMRTIGLDVDGVEANQGLVRWNATLTDITRANLHLRCVERITLEAGSFRALHFAEFRRKAAAIEWERWLAPGQPVLARVTSRASKLYHERALADRLRGAIADRLGVEPPAAEPASLDDPEGTTQLVVVRMVKDRCEVRIDTSGPRLHRRGYRLAAAKAPLRETLAAAILRWSGWDENAPLLDPFCGSGTFVIEAAMRAQSIAPGIDRHFAFERWPQVGADVLDSLRDEARASACKAAQGPPQCVGSDRDAGAVRAAEENAVRAGVQTATRFVTRSLSEAEPPSATPGWIVTNPPFGHRLSGEHDLRNLGARFGQVMQSRFSGWHVTMLAIDADFARATELRWREGPLVNDGGLKVSLLSTQIGD